MVEKGELKVISSRHRQYAGTALLKEGVCDLTRGCEICLFMIAVGY